MMRMTMMQEAHDVRLPEYVGDLVEQRVEKILACCQLLICRISNFAFGPGKCQTCRVGQPSR